MACIKQRSGYPEYFGIDRCLIASGDGDRQPKVIAEFGQLLNESLDLLLPDGENTIAVMGGTTMAKVAEELGNLETGKRHNLFVPARGGIGGSSQCSGKFSRISDGDAYQWYYRSLFVPEQLKH